MKSIREIYNTKSAIHCKTMDEAHKIGCALAKLSGKNMNRFAYIHKSNYCINADGLQYGHIDVYKDLDYKIYQASEFLNNYYEIY